MRILEMSADAFWKGEYKVRGLVEDGRERYRPSLSVKNGAVYEYSCSCPEGDSHRGMCVHCAALLEEYKRQKAAEGKPPAVTSARARTMIREYTNREVAGILSESGENRILFLPILCMGRGEMRLEFKVGRDRFYVVKDLAAFVKAVENRELAEYGKNLSFPHSLSSFSEESRPLVEFAVELAGACCEYYRQFQKGSPGRPPALRRLNLSRHYRDRFFQLMTGRSLEVEDAGGVKRSLTVEERDPVLKVRVEPWGGDGVKISMDKGFTGFSGERHLYMAAEHSIYKCSESCSNMLGVFVEQMAADEASPYETVVSARDMPLFYERVLKKIAAYSVIEADGVELESYRPEKLRAKFEFDSGGPNELTMKPTLSYGDFSFHPLEDEKVPRTVCRDVPGEFKISRLITRYFQCRESGAKNLVIRDDEEAVYRLLSRGIEEFRAAGEVWLSEAFQSFKVLPPPRVCVGVKITEGWLELNVDAGDLSGEELNRLLGEYGRRKKYYRLKTGEFLRLDGNGLAAVARLAGELAGGKRGFQDKKLRLPAYRAFYLDSVLKEEKEITFYRDALFKAVVRGIKSVEDSEFELPEQFAGVLRPYQKTGFCWMRTLDSNGFCGILADDMGLGKTVQVIALLADEAAVRGGKPSLIVCPASLVYNWESELKRFAGRLKVLTAAGSAMERRRLLESGGEADVILTSYDLLKKDIALYEGREFRFQIIDEAQYIKNAATQSARAVKRVKAVTRFALTGTPVENRLSELWSIFDYLMPGFLFSYSRFKKDYEIPVVREGSREKLEDLHRLIGPFVLRRLKKEVLKELPEKLETVVYSGMEEKQRGLYTANALELKRQLENGEEASRDKFAVLAKLTQLRQICCDPRLCCDGYGGGSAKLETCMDLIANGAAGGHKILLFSQFTSMLDLIAARVEAEGLSYYMLTGSTPKEERLSMVNAFRADGVPIFLISLKAGGTGLNLTSADIVIHYDPWWNAAAQNQATDRAHRIGQEKSVSVFKLIVKDTIEENILKLQEAKKDLAERIITEGTSSVGGLTREELIKLLDPGPS